jgi:hypothetical protein
MRLDAVLDAAKTDAVPASSSPPSGGRGGSGRVKALRCLRLGRLAHGRECLPEWGSARPGKPGGAKERQLTTTNRGARRGRQSGLPARASTNSDRTRRAQYRPPRPATAAWTEGAG